MEFKNYKSLTLDGLHEYANELTAEFNEIKAKIEELASEMDNLDDEYLDVQEEINNREKISE